MKKRDNKNKKEKEPEKNIFSLFGLTAISGIDFKKAAELHIALGVTTIKELYSACKENKVASLPGWGMKSQNRIKSEIEINTLWLMGQCNKVRAEQKSNYQLPLTDKETLLEMARNFNPEEL